jgi:hypothetical protein
MDVVKYTVIALGIGAVAGGGVVVVAAAGPSLAIAAPVGGAFILSAEG